jgi:fucose permease
MSSTTSDLVTPQPVAARVAISAVFFACGINMGVWATQIARLKLGFHLTDPGLAAVVLAFACGSIPTMPLAGALAARWGSVPAITATCIATAAGLVLLGIAPTYLLLLVAAVLAGGAIGALDVAMNGHATVVSMAFRRPVLSSIHGWFSLGGLAGSAAGGLLTGVGLPVAAVLGSGGAGILLTGLAAAPFLHIDAVAPTQARPGFAWPSRAMWGIGVMCLLSLVIEGGIIDWTTVYLHETAGASLAWAALGIAGFTTAMAVGRFTGDWVVHRFGGRTVMTASGLLTAAGIGLAVAVPLPVPASIGFLLAGVGMSNTVPLLFAAAGRVPGVPAAMGVAMAGTMGYGAFLMGPPLIGFVAGAASLRVALLLLVAASLGIALGGRWR